MIEVSELRAHALDEFAATCEPLGIRFWFTGPAGGGEPGDADETQKTVLQGGHGLVYR